MIRFYSDFTLPQPSSAASSPLRTITIAGNYPCGFNGDTIHDDTVGNISYSAVSYAHRDRVGISAAKTSLVLWLGEKPEAGLRAVALIKISPFFPPHQHRYISLSFHPIRPFYSFPFRSRNLFYSFISASTPILSSFSFLQLFKILHAWNSVTMIY